jgi:hypothetical protein
VLVEADTRVFGDAGGIRIERLKKILDFLLDLPLRDMDWRTTWWNGLSWLNLIVHFPLHPCSSPKKPGVSFQGSSARNGCKHDSDGEVSIFGGK